MFCRKCNTAISGGGHVCGYCGAKVNETKNVLLTAVALILTAGVILGLFAYYMRAARDPENFFAEETTHTEESTNPDASENAQTPERNQHDPESIPVHTPDYSKSMDEIRVLIDGIAEAALEFYTQFSPYAVYVTKYGYFFEYSSNQYIMTESLFDDIGLDTENADDNVLILYLKPSDLAGFKQLNVTSSDNLELFAAYETKEGFVIASVNNPGGVLPREDLQKVLEKYDFNHGEPRTVRYGGEDYNQIMSALVKEAGVEPDSDIRYMKQDDKYAVAILSPRGDATDVSQYILQKINSRWSIVIYNYEIYDKHKAVINEQLVDINLEMIPRDDLTVLRKYFRQNYTDIIGTMKMNSYIMDEDGAAVYQAGTNNFCFIIFESGRKFLGHLVDDSWRMYEVRNYDEAVEIMLTLEKWPPIVILRQY